MKTYIEQTKLLVSLASGFVLAPPAMLAWLRRPDGTLPAHVPWYRFFWAEVSLIASVLVGYVVLGTITGSQHDNSFNVYRPATRLWSLLQLILYLIGIVLFLTMVRKAL